MSEMSSSAKMALKELITLAEQDRAHLAAQPVQAAIKEVMAALDQGSLRICVKDPATNHWVTEVWLKQAILLYFAIQEMQVLEVGPFEYYDKIPLKKGLKQQGVRVIPPGVVRYGAYLEPGTVVMPGYVNIGAYVGAGSLVDTWATVGSCAQIGSNVHLSGGVGIGGVLEPPQASPVIIEDRAFIGSRCIIVEGVRVEEEAVIGAGVVLTSSTPIIDVTQETEIIYKGVVPKRSVVIPGMREKKFKAGTYQVPCALIIGQRQASTDTKTSLNEVLRRFAVPV